MSKRLLIAVDGSPASDAALTEAIAMADRDDAELRLVHIVDETTVAWGELASTRRRALDALADKGTRILDEAAERVRAAGQRTSRTTRVRERNADSIATLIAAEADAWGANLVVVGSRGYGPIRRALHGSVDSAVMRRSGVPVLAVRPVARTQGHPGQLPPAAPRHLGMA